jgi:hypothetical protein
LACERRRRTWTGESPTDASAHRADAAPRVAATSIPTPRGGREGMALSGAESRPTCRRPRDGPCRWRDGSGVAAPVDVHGLRARAGAGRDLTEVPGPRRQSLADDPPAAAVDCRVQDRQRLGPQEGRRQELVPLRLGEPFGRWGLSPMWLILSPRARCYGRAHSRLETRSTRQPLIRTYPGHGGASAPQSVSPASL